jgi:PrtD family type I secretion system ABC transporter
MFAGLFSLVGNLLYLALPLYTTQIYARVLTSHSKGTLYVLTFGALAVFLVSSVIDYFRGRVLINYGAIFDQRTSGQAFSILFDQVVRKEASARAQALRDLDTFRQMITGSGFAVLFDLPWIPIFMGILFLIDPIVGSFTLAGGVALFVLAILQHKGTSQALTDANVAALQSYAFTETTLRNGEVIRALGMLPALTLPWARYRQTTMERSVAASNSAAAYSNAIRMLRMAMQIVVVGLGAFLVLDGDIGPGVLFANMILGARALAPIERVVGAWTSLVGGYQAYKRLQDLFKNYEEPVRPILLPRPEGRVSVEGLTYGPRGSPTAILTNVSFALEGGETLGIVGPSGAGKSTLARLMVGVWKPVQGVIRLDGADVFQWDREDFGRYVGYLPQDIELFAGTVRQNISRFRVEIDDAAVVRAAQLAGAHEMILRLSKGYETDLGEGGAVLSVGQRQRVGLARALLGDPAYVVLDEPNASLDAEGEAALMVALEALKAAKATVVLVTHKIPVLQTADKLLVMKNGRVELFGPREPVLARLTQAPPTLIPTAAAAEAKR